MLNDGTEKLTTSLACNPVESVRRALAYHQRTKHHLNHYAKSPGYLDWATQPDPFRTYTGAAVVELPLLADAVSTSYADLHVPGAVRPRRLEVNTLAILFELALGLSAWKQFKANRWALRCNPSSGNLHPTEGYAIVPPTPGLEAGVYHYVSRDHCFERRCTLREEAANRLVGALPPGALLVGLSSIHWREAWKYGERAFRYCQHDAGHAIATFRYAAAALGWSAVLLDSVSDSTIATLLGLDRAEGFADVDKADREHPDAILLVSTQPPCPVSPPSMPNEVFCMSTWAGRANVLSSAHVEWCIIDDVAKATWKPATELPALRPPALLPPLRPTGNVTAATLIRQRRSCLALDGKTSLTAETFYGMLDHLLPRPGVPPWDVLPWPPHVHAGIFVHRIRELPPGLYLLERNECVHDRLSAATRSQFRWKRAPRCPEHLRLFCLAEVDLREAARVTSCHQEIASDGAFSLGMIADFGESIRRNGAWWYRRLFWEAGTLGHVLYLEAEAAGVRSTGIGCYFDDVFHELLGLTGDQFQSLYRFTVGGSTEDRRLTTIEPYAHLAQRKSCTREQ